MCWSHTPTDFLPQIFGTPIPSQIPEGQSGWQKICVICGELRMPKRTFLKLGTSAIIVSFASCSDYFGASEATIFSKRESFRSGHGVEVETETDRPRCYFLIKTEVFAVSGV